MSAPLLTSTVAGVALITLNRPEKRNALDRASIAALSVELERCAQDEAVRAVQITGAGQVFCAGADLGEMQAQRQAGAAQNLADAEQLASMLWISGFHAQTDPGAGQRRRLWRSARPARGLRHRGGG